MYNIKPSLQGTDTPRMAPSSILAHGGLDNQHTCKSRLNANIIFNAQPFGGGPSASLAAIMPYIRHRLKSWGPVALHYVGSSHALAFQKLQKKPECIFWDGMHNIDFYKDSENAKEELRGLFKHLQPLLVVTVSDESIAEVAQESGIAVVIIDLLLWWWHKIPSSWLKAECVIAADFYGVKERIAREGFTNVVTVPPLGPPLKTDNTGPRKNILLNFGGMLNPFVPAEEYIAYARMIYNAARCALRLRKAAIRVADSTELIVLAASSDLARCIDPENPEAACAVLPDEAISYMSTAEVVFCTPELGNIYGAAAVASTTVLLPPLNETQGLQSQLLAEAGICVDSLDWHQLTGNEPINYGNDMYEVLSHVSKAQEEVLNRPQAQALLVKRMFTTMMQSSNSENCARGPPLRALIDQFGQDNGDAMAAQVISVGKSR